MCFGSEGKEKRMRHDLYPQGAHGLVCDLNQRIKCGEKNTEYWEGNKPEATGKGQTARRASWRRGCVS